MKKIIEHMKIAIDAINIDSMCWKVYDIETGKYIQAKDLSINVSADEHTTVTMTVVVNRVDIKWDLDTDKKMPVCAS